MVDGEGANDHGHFGGDDVVNITVHESEGVMSCPTPKIVRCCIGAPRTHFLTASFCLLHVELLMLVI